MSFFSNPFKKIEEVATQAKNTVEKVVPSQVQPIKDGAQKAADFVMNSGDRAYWDKELSGLRSRFHVLKKAYYTEQERYNQLRIQYSEKFSTYSSILNSLPEAGNHSGVTFIPNSQIMTDLSQDFRIDADISEEVARFTLSMASGGITDIYFASQDAAAEASYWRKQNSKLEEVIDKIHSSIAKHEAAMYKLEQSIDAILQLYGPGTTIENVIQRVCILIAKQGANEVIKKIIPNLQARGESEEMIQEVIGLSDPGLTKI